MTYEAAMKSSKQLTYMSRQCTSSIIQRRPPNTHLALARAREMPLLAKLASATDVRDGEDCAVLLHPRQDRGAEERVDRDREAAVACESGETKREAKSTSAGDGGQRRTRAEQGRRTDRTAARAPSRRT